ncbi:hypothetical protein [Clostridium perfringens]|uniref:Uncharacterized protein n=1 Tax=Clostridium perfringens TaxID=1502 RepID=G5DSA0_CLOPF|nr:hypothetical protein [Clostridium perfringens]AEP94941.1 hypothetical protein pBeta2_00051 [Clostridium perfringens]AFV15137.1 hypothetical protein pCpb2-CP1_49 [Clostridium perfringens]
MKWLKDLKKIILVKTNNQYLLLKKQDLEILRMKFSKREEIF